MLRGLLQGPQLLLQEGLVHPEEQRLLQGLPQGPLALPAPRLAELLLLAQQLPLLVLVLVLVLARVLARVRAPRECQPQLQPLPMHAAGAQAGCAMHAVGARPGG